MANLDRKTIKNLTSLCRISCTEEEEELLRKDLEKILGYVAILQEQETEGIAPCHRVLSSTQNVLRDDEPEESLPTEEYLANCPDKVGQLVKIPTLIQKGKTLP